MENQKRLDRDASGGFTLIELLVVVAIIGLLASIVIVSLYHSRVKSRDTKRISDMTQMASALELYHNTYFGYPAATVAGVPNGMAPQFIGQLPTSPLPADGDCATQTNPAGQPANTYWYVPSGGSQVINGTTVYGTFNYYFCTSTKVGDVPAGQKTLSPQGVR